MGFIVDPRRRPTRLAMVAVLWLVTTVGVACANIDTGATEIGPTRAGETNAPDEGRQAGGAISITVVLDTDDPLIDAMTVFVHDDAGSEVGSIEFASAWIVPDDYFFPRDGLPQESGAQTVVELELPGPGSYTFDVPAAGVGYPRNTSAKWYGGGQFTIDIDDGDAVRIPLGDLESIS